MAGIAQKLFEERYGTLPWQKEPTASWQTLHTLLKAGIPFSLEFAMAERLLYHNQAQTWNLDHAKAPGLVDRKSVHISNIDRLTIGQPRELWHRSKSKFVPDCGIAPYNSTEAAAAFLCYLCLAVRQGHLCVIDSPQGLQPDPISLWTQIIQDKNAVDSGLLQRLEALITQGAHALPAALLQGPVVRWGNHTYLQRFHTYETIVCTQLKRLLDAKPSIGLDDSWVAAEVDQRRSGGILKDAQAEAIKCVCAQSVTFITGGPGTGKTYTASEVLHLLARGTKERLRVSLTAQTGKAAANLAAKLCLDDVSCEGAKTLHSLLSLNKRGDEDWSQSALGSDLIIVDESSMVDVYLMARLLSAVKTGARLVLLGDPEQLPSVQAGGVFADMVKALQGNAVHLEESVRTDSSDILRLANGIRMGESAVFNDLCGDVRCHSWPTAHEEMLRQAITRQVEPLLRLSLENASSALQSVRLLTPLRDGPWGVEQLNATLLQQAWKTKNESPRVIPIIISANDHLQKLFNGDVGVLVCHGTHAGDRRDNDYALIKDRRYPAVSLPRYESAFCLTVHRSQGSEYDNVMLLLPPRSEVFGREMLYTAVTRAKKTVQIWGSPQTIETILGHHMERLSGLKERLGNETARGIANPR